MIHFRFIFQILKQRNHNVTVQELVLSSLAKHGYSSPNDKCLLQCFELSTLEGIKGQTQKLGYYKTEKNHKKKLTFFSIFSTFAMFLCTMTKSSLAWLLLMLEHGWTDFNLDLTMVFYRFFLHPRSDRTKTRLPTQKIGQNWRWHFAKGSKGRRLFGLPWQGTPNFDDAVRQHRQY